MAGLKPIDTFRHGSAFVSLTVIVLTASSGSRGVPSANRAPLESLIGKTLMQKHISAGAAIIGLAAMLASAPAVVAAAPSSAPINCSKSMMASMMQSTSMTPTAAATAVAADSVDMAYAKAEKEILERQMAMAKYEMACGKDAATKSQARKTEEQSSISILKYITIIGE